MVERNEVVVLAPLALQGIANESIFGHRTRRLAEDWVDQSASTWPAPNRQATLYYVINI